MGKLKLNVDALKVEAFETEQVRGYGTVQGRDDDSVAHTGCACPAPPATGDTCTGQGFPGCTAKRTLCEPSCILDC